MNARQFIDGLAEQSIVDMDELIGLRRGLTSEQLAAPPAALARELIRQHKLTRYQAIEVFQRRGRTLVFGEYVVLDKLGEGGMGQVFKAEHRRMKRIVALKVLPPHSTNSKSLVDRFYKEVELAARLIHPNIVTAYDAGESRGLHFLAMEYVDGLDLSSHVKANGPLGIEQAMNCILQAARGLQYAHEQGIVHRDVKPSNLIASSRGVVKILDMGLARVEHSLAAPVHAGAAELTDSGQVLGTVDYMAPEQSYDSRLADQRSDIYSLGCTLYRVLTGATPYGGETLMQKLLAHREQPIPSLRTARPETPPALEALYRRMVAKSPDERPQSMREIVVALEGLLAGASEESSTVTHLQRLPGDDEGLDSFLQRMGGSGVGLGASRSFNSSDTPNPAASATLRIEPTSGSSRIRRPKKAPQTLVWGIAAAVTSVVFVVVASLLLNRPAKHGELAAAAAKKGAASNRLDAHVKKAPAKKSADKSKTAGKLKPAKEPPPSVAVVSTPPPVEQAKVMPDLSSPPASPNEPGASKESLPLAKVESLDGPVDLLTRIEPSPAATSGSFTNDDGLVAGDARFRLAAAPPDEYDLTAVIADLNQHGEFEIGLPVRNRATTLRFLHTYKSAWDIGLGRNAWRSQRAIVLGDGPLTLLCAVRKNRVYVAFDGRTAIDWSDVPGAPPLESNLVDADHRLFLHLKAKFRIASLQLSPPTATLPTYGVVDLLAEADSARDRASGTVRGERGDLLLDETSDRTGSSVALSHERPSEYVLTAVVERTLGGEQVEFGLPTGLGRAVAAVDRSDGDAQLWQVAGQGKTSGTMLLSPWRLHNIRCIATGDQMRLDVNGRELAVSDAPFNEDHLQLSAGVKDPGAFFIRAANTSAFRIHRLEVMPLGLSKLPQPSAQVLAAAGKELEPLLAGLRETRSKPGSPSASALKLWHEATRNIGDPARRWLLLDAAAQQAATDGDLVLAGHAAFDLARTYEADWEPWCATVFPVALRTAKSTPARQALALEALRQIEMAVALEELGLAGGMVASALSVKSLPADVQKELRSRQAEIGFWRELQKAGRQALSALPGGPDSKDDNRSAGEYLAIVERDWRRAAEHLGKAGETDWAELCGREAQSIETGANSPLAGDAADAAAIGDGWWALSTKAITPLKWWCMEQAAGWYRLAASSAVGKTKTSIEAKSKLLSRQRNTSGGAFRPRRPLDAQHIGDRWYKVYPTPMTWKKAEKICRDLGGSLPIVTTAQENLAVVKALASLGGGTERRICWLGGSDQAQEGVFRWLDGTAVASGFSNWRAGEPDNRDGREDSMAMLVVLEKGDVKTEWTDEDEAGFGLCVCVWDD
ncbi:MAG TPA: protein kinase [Pirellulales bacterium]|nr:protein kinase [Pirellulales bacterium]